MLVLTVQLPLGNVDLVKGLESWMLLHRMTGAKDKVQNFTNKR